jgi:hypothetical protein
MTPEAVQKAAEAAHVERPLGFQTTEMVPIGCSRQGCETKLSVSADVANSPARRQSFLRTSGYVITPEGAEFCGTTCQWIAAATAKHRQDNPDPEASRNEALRHADALRRAHGLEVPDRSAMVTAPAWNVPDVRVPRTGRAR